MSCRVLGRQVEQATLNILAAKAREMGCSHLVGVLPANREQRHGQDAITKSLASPFCRRRRMAAPGGNVS